MKKQTEIEKEAFAFALQIFNLINTFPKEEKALFGHELAREAVKLSSGILTFIYLNELNAAFDFLNNAFSATFRVEIYLLASKDLHFVESIDRPMKSLLNLRQRLDKMLNRLPEDDVLEKCEV